MGLGGGRSDPGRDDVAIARGFLDGQAAATQFKVANMASSYLLTSEVPVADGHFAHMTSVTDKLARKLWDEVYGALEWRLTGQ